MYVCIMQCLNLYACVYACVFARASTYVCACLLTYNEQNDKSMVYVLPDGNQIRLNGSRYTAPEALFIQTGLCLTLSFCFFFLFVPLLCFLLNTKHNIIHRIEGYGTQIIRRSCNQDHPASGCLYSKRFMEKHCTKWYVHPFTAHFLHLSSFWLSLSRTYLSLLSL